LADFFEDSVGSIDSGSSDEGTWIQKEKSKRQVSKKNYKTSLRKSGTKDSQDDGYDFGDIVELANELSEILGSSKRNISLGEVQKMMMKNDNEKEKVIMRVKMNKNYYRKMFELC